MRGEREEAKYTKKKREFLSLVTRKKRERGEREMAWNRCRVNKKEGKRERERRPLTSLCDLLSPLSALSSSKNQRLCVCVYVCVHEDCVCHVHQSKRAEKEESGEWSLLFPFSTPTDRPTDTHTHDHCVIGNRLTCFTNAAHMTHTSSSRSRRKADILFGCLDPGLMCKPFSLLFFSFPCNTPHPRLVGPDTDRYFTQTPIHYEWQQKMAKE